MKNHRLFLASPILIAASVMFTAPTVLAQSDSINDLVRLMPCQASCEWVYNIDSGRLCERDAELSCANVGHDRPCEDTAMLTCNRAE